MVLSERTFVNDAITGWEDVKPKILLVALVSSCILFIKHAHWMLPFQISKSGVITKEQRDGEWQTLQEEIKRGGVRPFCRAVAQDNRMWAGTYLIPCRWSIFIRRDKLQFVPDLNLRWKAALYISVNDKMFSLLWSCIYSCIWLESLAYCRQSGHTGDEGYC